MEASRPKLVDDISNETFEGLLSELEALSRTADLVHAYAGLRFAANTQDQKAQSFVARVQQFMAGLQNRVLFFDLWWKDLDEANARRLMGSAGEKLYYLERIRAFKPYTLSEAEEKIINIKDVTGVSALTTLYDSITNRYIFKVDLDGQVHDLTRGQAMVYARHHDPELRESVYRELYRVYGHDGPILGQMYQTLVRDWFSEQVGLRGHSSPLSVRNLGNDIPDPVVDTLLEVGRDNVEVFRRFFRIKAKRLGMDRLRRYDLYAPVSVSDKKYDFSMAVETVMDAFYGFDDRFARMAEQVLKDGHLDSEVRPGKRDGAFCASVLPEMTPYVLMNFQGRPDDAATLAHELGHAVHSQMASKHSIFTFQATLPLAENASTFGEMLLLERLLSKETDENVRRDLLFRQVDDAYATIMRQTYFALFERQAHEMIRDGATVEDLSAAYLDNLKAQFGETVNVGDEFRWEWVSIPHIYHTPFYVYAYAFGQLLVFALYREYQAGKTDFKSKYLKILEAGGSKSPESILTEAGLDMRSRSFWQGGFEVVADLVAQLEALP